MLWRRRCIAAAAAAFSGGGGGVVAAAIGLLEWRCGGVSAAAFRRCCSNVYDGESNGSIAVKRTLYISLSFMLNPIQICMEALKIID